MSTRIRVVFAECGAALLAILLPLISSAGDFYVDANNGNDLWDGSSATRGAGDVGPKKTLAAAMAGRTNGDVVIALPGEYKDGVSNPEAIGTVKTLNRVTVPMGVTLLARDGKDVTFIVGADSDAPDKSANGCGTNATRCVYAADGGTVRGFTICGGRTFTGSVNGGGVSGGTIIDCIVSNNCCSGRGGGINNGDSINCRYVGNSAALGIGPNVNMGTHYNCFFADGQTYQGTYYHCTFAADSYPRAGSSYNSLVLGTGSSSNGSASFHCCYHKANPTSDCTLDDDCVTFSSVAAIGVDSDGCPTSSGSSIVDKGNMSYYGSMVSLARELDVDGQARLYNGAADIGCHEYNFLGEFSDILSKDGVIVVTNATGFVTGCVDCVSIGTNQMMKGTLELYGDSETLWSFNALVRGSGTFTVYLDDAVSPYCTLTADDGMIEITYSAAETTGIRLVYEGGEGAAEVSRFANATRLSIIGATEGLSISGDYTTAGTYVVAPGEQKTVTFNRANAGTTYVSGIRVNGVFHGFSDSPDGFTFTVYGSQRETAISVECVTEERKELFVDRVGGDDGNCGLYTNMAFRSLAKAASLASSGWTILASPGVYDNEVSNPEAVGTDVTLNRVAVPAGVTLQALGPVQDVVIEGTGSSDVGGDDLGNGIGGTRCVFLGKDAKVVGFTIRGGRTAKVGSTGQDAMGGGVSAAESGCMVIGCVLTNNCCAYRGGAAFNVAAYRCLFTKNSSKDAGAAMFWGTAYSCCFDSHPYLVTTYCCTFIGDAYARDGSHYNGLFLGANEKYNNSPSFYNCYLSYAPQSSVTTPVLDEHCVITNAESLAIDEDYRPVAGSPLIDAGNVDYLAAGIDDFRNVDFAGGQRVYNGAVDVGCGEYDWRGDYGNKLSKYVVVEVASTNVTQESEGVSVPAGEMLKFHFFLTRAGGRCKFRVVGAATVTETLGGVTETLVPTADGVYTLQEIAVQTAGAVVAVTGGEGGAVVCDVEVPRYGFVIVVR